MIVFQKFVDSWTLRLRSVFRHWLRMPNSDSDPATSTDDSSPPRLVQPEVLPSANRDADVAPPGDDVTVPDQPSLDQPTSRMVPAELGTISWGYEPLESCAQRLKFKRPR